MGDLQKQIIEELKVLPEINPEEEVRKSVDFLKKYAKRQFFLKKHLLLQ